MSVILVFCVCTAYIISRLRGGLTHGSHSPTLGSFIRLVLAVGPHYYCHKANTEPVAYAEGDQTQTKTDLTNTHTPKLTCLDVNTELSAM